MTTNLKKVLLVVTLLSTLYNQIANMLSVDKVLVLLFYMPHPKLFFLEPKPVCTRTCRPYWNNNNNGWSILCYMQWQLYKLLQN